MIRAQGPRHERVLKRLRTARGAADPHGEGEDARGLKMAQAEITSLRHKLESVEGTLRDVGAEVARLRQEVASVSPRTEKAMATSRGIQGALTRDIAAVRDRVDKLEAVLKAAAERDAKAQAQPKAPARKAQAQPKAQPKAPAKKARPKKAEEEQPEIPEGAFPSPEPEDEDR